MNASVCIQGPVSGDAVMVQLHSFTSDCPWIAPCPVCGAVCQVRVDSTADRLIVDVDYACKRKHAQKGS